MIGATLSHYKILDLLGEGGMGRVYLAEDTALQRKVALKVLPEEVAGDSKRLERFIREAKTVAQLNHPNIVTIHSVEKARPEKEEPPVHFITMELVEGKRLSDIIPTSGLPLAKFFELAIPLADAVSSAHDRGVTHRDLKPANIMVTSDGRVKVLDFGLAKTTDLPPGAEAATQLPTATLTASDKVVGTVAYMSPQQAEGKPLDHRSDIFSLGIVLSEMATGQRPFRGGSSAQIVSAILRDTPPPVTDLRAETPNHLARIIKHCLEKEPNDRFQTARDVHNELKQLREEIAAETAAEREATSRTIAPLVRPRRSWLAAAGLWALLAGSVGVVAYFLASRTPDKSSPTSIATTTPTRLAILPLANLTGDPDQGYLAKGISTLLINQLSEISEISVLSHNYVGSYDTTPEGVRRLVRDSGIDAYVEGYIQGDGDSLRVYANLTDSSDGSVLSALDFEGTVAAVFDLQNRIVQAISQELSVVVSAASLERLNRRPTASETAFRHFLEGLTLLSLGPESGDAARAESLFRRALREDPDFAHAHWGLSQALLEGFYADAGPGFLQQAEEAARVAVRLDPEFHRAHITLATICREDGRLQEAIDQLESVSSEDLRPRRLFEELAITYDELGDLTRSLENIDRALAQRSDSEVYLSLGRSYAAAGEDDKALAYFEKAVADDSEMWLNHHELGVYHLDRGDFDQAEFSLRRARELAPEEALPLRNLARLELDRFNLEAALAIYETIPAVQLDASTASNLGTAYFYYDAPGSLGKAEEYYLLAVRLRPGNFQLQANLGDLYVRQGRTGDALTQYAKALTLVEEQLEMLPNRPLLQLKQPVYLAKLGRCSEAVPHAERLDSTLARNLKNLRSIAQAFALCGSSERAIDVLTQAIPLGYPFENMKQEDEFKSLHSNPRFQALAEL